MRVARVPFEYYSALGLADCLIPLPLPNHPLPAASLSTTLLLGLALMCYCRPHVADYVLGALTLGMLLLGLALLLGPLFVETAHYRGKEYAESCRDQSSYEACCSSSGECLCQYTTTMECVEPHQQGYEGVSLTPPSSSTVAMGCSNTPGSLGPLPTTTQCSTNRGTNGAWRYVSRCNRIDNCYDSYGSYYDSYYNYTTSAFFALLIGVSLAWSLAFTLGVIVWLSVRCCKCCSCSIHKQMAKDYAREQAELHAIATLQGSVNVPLHSV